ncbi:unnamed protein product [Hermetia illucens]|uniref:Serum response factor-binding protein 1 n=1 Tax=Hermetia illucens TaxID=343691 RepID=A0A7R8V5P2_HERIL|nr:serum response factor-binding protein 1 [Hermetia illucens]CAD7092125.1 unnamed protein product [Hermetia illucens]
MLDKLQLNNQILANKAAVQKARLILVNKQVQKLRKLKQLKDKHPENKKLEMKFTRATEVLACLKKIKFNEILRQALLNQKSPSAVITNGLSTPEEIAQALYFSHKTIEEIVKHLKSVLNINDSDTSWRDQVVEPSKRKRKQQRTERKQQFRQERKARKELEKKRNEWLVENLPSVPQESEAPVESEEKPNTLQAMFQEEDVDKVKQVQQDRKKQQEKVRVPKEEAPVEDSSLESDEKHEAHHTVDDFFITQTGDHYLSTVVIDRKQPDQPDDGMVRKERRSIQNGHHRYPEKRRKFDRQDWHSHNDRATKPFKRDNIRNTKPLKGSSSSKENDTASNQLHPSWAAKQRQKRIEPPQGSKIVFDDEGNTASKVVNSKSKESSVKSVPKSDSKEKLHPSWEAKQKLKPSIAQFTGKKIVFDDE